MNDNDARTTGRYEITAYRHGGEVRWAMTAYGPREQEGIGQYELLNEDGRVQEIHLPDEILSEPHEGDWWYALNDGGWHTGPFISREAAIKDAREHLEFRRTDGEKVLSITEVN